MLDSRSEQIKYSTVRLAGVDLRLGKLFALLHDLLQSNTDVTPGKVKDRYDRKIAS